MPLIGTDDRARIDLPTDGEWVEVKRRMSRGDEIAVQRMALRGLQVDPTNPKHVIVSDPGEAVEAAEFATLDVAILAWSFDVPVTPEAIRRLDPDSVAAIKARLADLYPAPRTEDDRKN